MVVVGSSSRAGICCAIALSFFAASSARGGCYEAATSLYPQVPITWLKSIARVESNADQNAFNKNTNGSVDIGMMQINSYWQPYLGAEKWQLVKSDACYNVIVGAWVLDQCIGRHGLTWKAVGCYNSPSRDQQLRYAAKVVPLINVLEKQRWSEYRAAMDATAAAKAGRETAEGGPPHDGRALPNRVSGNAGGPVPE